MNYYEQPGGQIPPPQMYYPPENYVPPEEKRSIRHRYNVIGLTLLIMYIATDAACYIAFDFLYSRPETTVEYDEYGSRILSFGFLFAASCFPVFMEIIVFIGHCLLTRYNPKELFRTDGLRAGEIFRFVMIVLFFQQVSYLCTIFISVLLADAGLGVPSVNYTIEHTPRTYVLEAVSSVILAPIAEELVYRGIVLRCSAKISQRFGIFFSAFIFGLAHGNPYQFLLGFMNGVILAVITIKTGSLIPSIICHMANNIMGTIPTVIGYFDEDTEYTAAALLTVIFFITGLVVFIHSVMTGKLKLPEYTTAHRARTLPIIITSWSTVLIIIFYLFDLITSIQNIDYVLDDTVTETVRIFWR